MLPTPKLFTLCYFAPISWYTCAVVEGEHFLEHWDTFQKQTYRNRCEIYSPNGPMSLVIPVVHDKNKKNLYRDTRMDDRQKWRQVHRKSIETAYSNSPFFPYFEDDLRSLYESEEENLFAFNLKCHEWVEQLIQKKLTLQPTDDWDADFEGLDLRERIHPKKESPMENPDEYHQSFRYKLGFFPDLSILDVVFNLGMETHSYLINNRSKLKL